MTIYDFFEPKTHSYTTKITPLRAILATASAGLAHAATNALIDTINPVFAPLPASSDWTTLGPFDLSAADNTIYLQFRYVETNEPFVGFYIDDVMVLP